VVPNLLSLLSHMGPVAGGLYLGRSISYPEEDGLVYQSGGAGYVLDRGALERLVEHGLDSAFCRPNEVRRLSHSSLLVTPHRSPTSHSWVNAVPGCSQPVP
jgi:hypothetical protein